MVQIYTIYLCPPTNHTRFYTNAQKKRGQNSVYLSLRSSTTYPSNKRVKPTPDGVSVIALLLMEFESVEVSKTRSKLNAFPICLKCAYQLYANAP